MLRRSGPLHPMFQTGYCNVTCERPPRPCQFGTDSFLDGTATPPFQGGESISPVPVSLSNWATRPCAPGVPNLRPVREEHLMGVWPLKAAAGTATHEGDLFRLTAKCNWLRCSRSRRCCASRCRDGCRPRPSTILESLCSGRADVRGRIAGNS